MLKIMIAYCINAYSGNVALKNKTGGCFQDVLEGLATDLSLMKIELNGHMLDQDFFLSASLFLSFSCVCTATQPVLVQHVYCCTVSRGSTLCSRSFWSVREFCMFLEEAKCL